MNRATLIGNVGNDPKIKTFESGDEVANFSLATSKRWKNSKGEKQERTEWHNIVVRNQNLLPVIRQYVKKGGKIALVGEIQTREYDKDGEKRYITEIVIGAFGGEIELLGSKQEDYAGDSVDSGQHDYQKPTSGAYQPNAALDDEIPF